VIFREREEKLPHDVFPETRRRGVSIMDFFQIDTNLTQEHKQRIEEEEKEREEKMNSLRTSEYKFPEEDSPFPSPPASPIATEAAAEAAAEAPVAVRLDRMIGSLFQHVFRPRQLNEFFFVRRENVDDMLEPVRVTVDDKNFGKFLVKKPYREVTKEEIHLTEMPDTCSICMEKYKEEDETCYLKTCCHIFHEECVRTWLLTYNHRCPMCRLSADPSKNTD
jgi:hypothetical protein